MSKEESASYHSWEDTVKRIFRQNADNVLLEFTATCDLANPAIKAEYLDKIIFNYPLAEFRKDGYSKEIMTLRTDVSVMDRALLAVVMSQYRLKVFQDHRKDVRPVILFKARTVAESVLFMEEFIECVTHLTADDVARLARLVDNPTLNAAFAYFQKRGITATALAQEIKEDFSRVHCISANDEKEAEARQIALNSLEDPGNPYRAIFEVKKLDEGWDVLNLFDIVRLYETRQSGGKSISATTIAEAQLIGRGSRYCPFKVEDGQDKFKRKYDNDAANPLRICEELYYHCQIDPRYIAELKNALKQIGADIDKRRVCEYRLKETFKTDVLYKTGLVFVNEQVERPRKENTGIPQYVKDSPVEYRANLGSSREGSAFGDDAPAEDIRCANTVELTIAGIAKMNYAFVWKPMCKFPALRFDRLKRRFPELDSSRQFVEQDLYAGNIRIDVTALEITPDVICAAVEEALKRIVPVVEADVKEYEGTRVFKGKKLNTLITDKTCVYADPETGTDGLGISQNESPKWAIDLSREDWFAFEDNFGTTEEKNFVMHFKGLAERLRPSFANIWLVRNERQVCLFSFKEGRRFEPDYILFLKRSKNSSKTEQIQVFVEPKGEYLIENDKWKEEFLLEIERTGHPVFDVADTMEYKIVGCHFYNESDAMRKKSVSDEILSLCGGQMPKDGQEIPEALKFREYLPLYSIEAACGKFGVQKSVEPEGWVKVSGVRKRNERLFAVRAKGKSMEPAIKDGSICTFEHRGGTCDNNDIVLVQHADVMGDESMGAYTIKKFTGTKKDGGWVAARLVPTNDDFDEIKLVNKGRDVRSYRIVGIYRGEIKVAGTAQT